MPKLKGFRILYEFSEDLDVTELTKSLKKLEAVKEVENPESDKLQYLGNDHVL